MKSILLLAALIPMMILDNCKAQDQSTADYPKALVSYDDYEELVEQVKKVRSTRLISFNELLKHQKDPNTVILDTRSSDLYAAKHVKGAINLPFTEFTQANLRNLIPDTNTRIIIYCNNNFEGDRRYFASKMFTPEMAGKMKMVKNPYSIPNQNSILLPLNIPTYINLYGYGYRNIYELDELVDIDDPRVKLDGHNGLGIQHAQLTKKRGK